MNVENFIVVGENIHCTRIVKSGGKRSTKLPDGTDMYGINYISAYRAGKLQD